MSKHILLMHISDISGHKEASSAIERAVHSQGAGVKTLAVNIFDYTGPTTAKIITGLYTKAIKDVPAVWGFLYDNQAIITSTKIIKQFVYSRGYKKIKSLIQDFNPEAVVATQAFPCGVCAEYKKRTGDKFKLIAVMTDYAPHSYWFENGVDYYVVGSEEVREILIRKGIPKENIKVFGIPIDSKFNEPIEQQKVIEKLKIDKNLPIVLIMGGGQGLGPIEKIINSLDKTKAAFQIILVCGINEKLEKEIKEKIPKYKKKIIVYGFIKNIQELMAISSLIITKAGGLTTSEAVSKGLPMVIVNPIPGQEVFNTNYLVKKGVAIYAKNINKINRIIDALLNDKEKLDDMRKKALEISKAGSSVDIAKFVLTL